MTDVRCDTTPENTRHNFCFQRDASLKVVLGVRRLHIYLAVLQISSEMSFLGLPSAPVTLSKGICYSKARSCTVTCFFVSGQRLSLVGFPGGSESACNAGDLDGFLVGKIHYGRDRLSAPVFLGFPCGSVGKESTSNVGDLGSVLRKGRSPGERKGDPPQYSGLENSMDCIVHGVVKSQTGLNDFHFHCLTSLHDY